MTSKQQEQLDKYIDAVVEEAIYSHDQEMMKKLVEGIDIFIRSLENYPTMMKNKLNYDKAIIARELGDKLKKLIQEVYNK